MAGTARSVNDLPRSDKFGMVDMRSGGRARAGSYVYEGRDLASRWHAHDLHQLEYAVRGVVEVETAKGHYLLPPQQAAWIPAGLRHRSTIATSVTSISVFFAPSMVGSPGERVRILAVPLLLRELVVHATRWPVDRVDEDPVADSFFATLGHLVAEGLEHEAPLHLPSSPDPIVSTAMAYTGTHLATATAAEVARNAGVSERTLRRRFHDGVGMTWRGYLLRARLLRAMALLSEPGPSVLDVAVAVGFDSASAFNRAFRAESGETPSAYRARVLRRESGR